MHLGEYGCEIVLRLYFVIFITRCSDFEERFMDSDKLRRYLKPINY